MLSLSIKFFVSTMMFRLLSYLLLALFLTRCADYRPSDAPFNAELTDAYRFGPGDRLRITVFDQPNLTNIYPVDKEGMVTLPLVNMIEAKNRTAEELQADIEARLAENYLRNPDVTVEVAAYRPIFVFGEVRNAGQYPYVANMTAQTAVAISGGFTSRAVKNSADLSRTQKGKINSYRVPMTQPLQPGDTIYVRERWF